MFGGMLVGSTFSLGISYMADLLASALLHTGDLLCGMFYSIGGIIGQFLGGLMIQYLKGGSFFYRISIILFIIFISLVFFKENKDKVQNLHM